MLVGTLQQGVNAWAAAGSARLNSLMPRLLTDGTYVLPESSATDQALPSAARTELASWAVGSPSAALYQADQFSDQNPRLNSRVAGLDVYHGGRRGAVTLPDPKVFRFEVRPNDVAVAIDSTNQNRRSELVAANNRYYEGTTLWTSFAVIFGPCAGLRKIRSGPSGLIHQWHSVDTTVSRSPGFCIDASNNELKITTRSDADINPVNGNGVPVVHYTMSLPAQGVVTYIVCQVTLGEFGHINAWVNGTQVVNTDQPIGYWTDADDGRPLAYPHWGLYSRNDNTTDVVYNANQEFGTSDLSARITAPLAVPDLSPWN